VVAPTSATAEEVRNGWNRFVDTVVITAVQGETPNITDSGFTFARKARQNLQIEQQRIMDVRGTLELLTRGHTFPVVFVDDFVGSGNQFVETWQREFEIDGVSMSFERFCMSNHSQFYYCPLVCTQVGYSRIRSECGNVVISPGHLLPSRYSALAADSI